jgi:Raf kinase inhibitor-like YbhB/YbcL family protein
MGMARLRDHRFRGRLAAALLLAGSTLLSGCGLLSGPRPLSEDAPLIMEVTSPVVTKGILPAKFTCNATGQPQTPPVSWSGAPPHTKSYVLIIDDSNAPITPWVYWLVFDIGPATDYIQAGTLPPGARVARNSTGEADYAPPCPAGAPHRYRITVYALNTALTALPDDPQLLPTWTSIAPHVLARGTMNATACPAAAVAAAYPACRLAGPDPHR